MPDRIIRAGCLDSERLDALSESTENFYKRLLNIVDDYGRFEYDALIILSRTYPRRINRITPEMVDNWLKECSKGPEPLVTLYTIGRKRFLQVNDFRQRERSPSKCPPPPGVVDRLARKVLDGQLSDIRPAAAGLARATNTHTPTTTHTHLTEGGTGETMSGVVERQAVALKLATELHRQHPEPCSLPQAQAAAFEQLEIAEPGVLPVDWANSVRQNYAVHLQRWLAERAKKPGAYVPALHVWFRDGMYAQGGARPAESSVSAREAHYKAREERKKAAKKEGAKNDGRRTNCA